jgi:hypothetical protein
MAACSIRWLIAIVAFALGGSLGAATLALVSINRYPAADD